MLGRDCPGKEVEGGIGRANQIPGSRYAGHDTGGWLHLGSELIFLSCSSVAVSLCLCSSRPLKPTVGTVV